MPNKDTKTNPGVEEYKDTLVLFANPADQEKDPAHPDRAHRGNTPWYVCFPSLGIAVQAKDRRGEPVTGYWEEADAIAFAYRLYTQVINNPDKLVQLREHIEWPENFAPKYKAMHRVISVPV